MTKLSNPSQRTLHDSTHLQSAQHTYFEHASNSRPTSQQTKTTTRIAADQCTSASLQTLPVQAPTLAGRTPRLAASLRPTLESEGAPRLAGSIPEPRPDPTASSPANTWPPPRLHPQHSQSPPRPAAFAAPRVHSHVKASIAACYDDQPSPPARRCTSSGCAFDAASAPSPRSVKGRALDTALQLESVRPPPLFAINHHHAVSSQPAVSRALPASPDSGCRASILDEEGAASQRHVGYRPVSAAEPAAAARPHSAWPPVGP